MAKKRRPTKEFSLKVDEGNEDFSSEDETPRSGSLMSTHRPLVNKHRDTDAFEIVIGQNDKKKLFRASPAKVVPMKNPLHEIIAKQCIKPEDRPVNTAHSMMRPGNNSLIDESYEYPSHVSWNKIHISTKDQGK